MTKALEKMAWAARLVPFGQRVDDESLAMMRAALLAALDPKDDRLALEFGWHVVKIVGQDPNQSEGWNINVARAAIAALRNHICGESSDGG